MVTVVTLKLWAKYAPLLAWLAVTRHVPGSLTVGTAPVTVHPVAVPSDVLNAMAPLPDPPDVLRVSEELSRPDKDDVEML